MREIKAILADRIYTPVEDIPNGVILMEGHRILKVGPREKVEIPKSTPIIDNRDRLIVPGFVDMHIHGAAGRDLMEGTADAVAAVAHFIARHGTTSFLATTVTARLDRTVSAAEALASVIGASQLSQAGSDKVAGAQPIGIHFEGPFLNPKRRGAHPAAQIRKPSVETAEQLLDAAKSAAKIVVLAPEQAGALEIIQYLRGRGVLVGLGHSDATYAEAKRAIDAACQAI